MAMVAAAAEVAEAAQAAGVTEEPAAVNDQAEVTPDEEQGEDDDHEDDDREERTVVRAAFFELRQQGLSLEQMEQAGYFDSKQRAKAAPWNECLLIGETNPYKQHRRTHMCTRLLEDGSVCCHPYKLQMLVSSSRQKRCRGGNASKLSFHAHTFSFRHVTNSFLSLLQRSPRHGKRACDSRLRMSTPTTKPTTIFCRLASSKKSRKSMQASRTMRPSPKLKLLMVYSLQLNE